MVNGLVELTPELEPVPELADSWEVREDGALNRFHLRDGVTWHDGEPFTSADMTYTFEAMLLPLQPAPRRPWARPSSRSRRRIPTPWNELGRDG